MTKPTSGERAAELRIQELTAERDHWKANHDAQVERAQVLLNRADMPLERIKAYGQIGELRKKLAVKTMLLYAFTGALQKPDGAHPFDDTPDQFAAGQERLRDAYCVQQPAPIPDQMALVWRADVMRLANSYTHKNAFFETHRGTPGGRRETQLINALRVAVVSLRKIAEPVGPLHAFWDEISDFECLIKGWPTLGNYDKDMT